MSEHTSRLLASNEPALAPLLRDDLPSFLVSVRDARIVAATAACARLGLHEDQATSKAILAIVQMLAAGPNGAPRLERVRPPAQFTSLVFSCSCISSPIGRLVLFADPRALQAEAEQRTPEGSSPAAPEEPRPVRFTWGTDGEGFIRFVSPSAFATLGPRFGAWSGRSFRQLMDIGVLRDSHEIDAALASGSSFSEIIVHTEEVPSRRISLGGLPLFDAGRNRTGVRGFGLLWPPATGDDTHLRMSRGTEGNDPPLNVVPLRGGPLTQRERSAFHEIARTLHEAVNGWNAPQDEPSELQPEKRTGQKGDMADIRSDVTVQHDLKYKGDAAPDQELQGESLGPASLPPHAEGPAELDAQAARPETGVALAEARGLHGADSADSLLDRLPLGIAVQQQGQFVRVNRTILGWAGVSDAEAFQLTGGVAARLSRVGGGQLHFMRAEGEALPVEVRMVSAPWNGETALVHLVRAVDVGNAAVGATEPLPARARGEALDLISVPVALLDGAGALLELNLAAAHLAGVERSAMLGAPLHALFGGEDREQAESLFATLAVSPDGHASATGLRLRGGAEAALRVDVTIAPAGPAKDNGPPYCLVLRETAPSDAPRLDLAQDAGTLLRRLSHGVREPLNVMFGFVEGVRSGAFGSMGSRRYSKLAEDAVVAGRQLMATLEDIEGLIPPAAPAHRSVLDVNAIVEEAVSHLAGAAQRRRIVIRRDLGPSATIRCDGARTAQMVRLLLEEALRATPDGQYVLISTVAERENADRAMTSVAVLIRDEGQSLSEEEIAQALDITRHAEVADRFGTAGLPFRMARIAALARSVGGELGLRRGIQGGMLSELRLPK
ncbi:HAMP domain-containing sensor histidine kinase [Xanthobacter sp. DSM 24535]|uniref:sensor histidine kinase n=1 Tax=Roseixanthobacter psychrophilus TaxID=3119917 RepID=UPI0037287D48